MIAVDLQHDAHLMQQDLFSVRNDAGEQSETSISDANNWRDRLRERMNKMMLKKTTFTPHGDGNHEHLDSDAGESGEANPYGQ
ncbi:NTE family protein rssA [Serratia fonticola]|uniref:NTE family protein rssA n=1 Tax=Serratia fonticola TaxID=47917 RepID=A0A4U9VBF7_SERFO|nr:NTE family protein rssA [Serratia fonticola]